MNPNDPAKVIGKGGQTHGEWTPEQLKNSWLNLHHLVEQDTGPPRRVTVPALLSCPPGKKKLTSDAYGDYFSLYVVSQGKYCPIEPPLLKKSAHLNPNVFFYIEKNYLRFWGVGIVRCVRPTESLKPLVRAAWNWNTFTSSHFLQQDYTHPNQKCANRPQKIRNVQNIKNSQCTQRSEDFCN